MAWPLGMKCTPLTGAWCSENVTKQKPVCVFQTLTFPSSPPDTILSPAGENAITFMPYACPCTQSRRRCVIGARSQSQRVAGNWLEIEAANG